MRGLRSESDVLVFGDVVSRDHGWNCV